MFKGITGHGFGGRARTGRNKSVSLTQDSTLRIVCGCLANVIGSTVDPVRPAPNEPTPSMFRVYMLPSSLLHALPAPRGRMDG